MSGDAPTPPPGKRKRAAFILAAMLFGVLASAGLDRAAGFVLPEPVVGEGLLYPPHSRVLYETPEYRALATVNALGFRGPEFPLDRTPGVQRILALGDSFTYGWGVAIEDAWPARVEAHLRDAGLAVEVANLGQPGGETGQYVALARRAVPLLQPDWLVVALVPGNDIYQLGNPRMVSTDSARAPRRLPPFRVARAGAPRPLRWLVDAVIPRVYPTATRVLRGARVQRITDQWAYVAPGLLHTFTPVEMRRFQQLEPEVQRVYLQGQLYPTAILVPMKDPNFWLRYLDTASDTTQALIAKMGEHLRELRAVAAEHNARVLLVGLPAGPYCNRPSQAGHRRCGYNIPDRLIRHDGADEVIARAAEMAGLLYVSCTATFREHADANLYFELDNHLTVAGQHLFAECAAQTVADALAHPEQYMTDAPVEAP